MSNHHHMVLTDPEARLPEFCHLFHMLVAKALNYIHDECENLWEPGSFSAVRLEGAEDILEKIVYVYMNPVEAELVATWTSWPGSSSKVRDLLGSYYLRDRPRVYFKRTSDCPRRVGHRLTMPSQLVDRDPHVIVEELEMRLAFEESRKQDIVRAMGRRFLGVQGVLAQSPFGLPSSRLPRGNLNPTIAAKNPLVRIQALLKLLAFRRRYQECRQLFRSGIRDVLFPPGTYGPRVFCGVLVESPAPV